MSTYVRANWKAEDSEIGEKSIKYVFTLLTSGVKRRIELTLSKDAVNRNNRFRVSSRNHEIPDLEVHVTHRKLLFVARLEELSIEDRESWANRIHIPRIIKISSGS